MQRVLRGASENKISRSEIEAAMDAVMVESSEGNKQLKDTLTDDELRSFLGQLKQLADGAEIPDASFEVKISEEFRKAVDRALQKPDA